MNHLSRLLNILTLLKSKRLITGAELAKRYDVSLRTIYRDIRKLTESGVPIITIEGRGYSIMEGYTVPPIMFDTSEVNALVTAEKLIAKTNDDSLIEHFGQTLQKIKSVFKDSLLEQAEMIDSKMLVLKNNPEQARTASLSSLQLAITNFRVTELWYQVPGKETLQRTVEPLAVYSFHEKWILVAWCRLRQDYRAFRLDRMKSFKILEEHFADRNFDLQEYFLKCAETELNP